MPSTTWKQIGNVRQLQRFCIYDVSDRIRSTANANANSKTTVIRTMVPTIEGKKSKKKNEGNQMEISNEREKKTHIDELGG